jgi:hypothetical protein
VPDPPQFLTLEEHRDADHRVELGVRRAFVAAVAALAALALANVFGQVPRHSEGTGAAATLAVSAPDRLRGGLLYQARFTIRAERELEHATLVLDRGWVDGMTINTFAPDPLATAYRDGTLALDYGRVAAGDELQAWLQFQVNPTTVGRRSQGVALHDGEEPLAAVDRTVTIFP